MKVLPQLGGDAAVLEEPFPRQSIVLDPEAGRLVLEVGWVEDKLAAFGLQLTPHHGQTLVELEVLVGLVNHKLLVLDLVNRLDTGPIQTRNLFGTDIFLLIIALFVRDVLGA